MNIDEYFSSPDLSLVTTLSLWFPIDSIDKTNPTRFIFLFKRESGLDELIQSYWNGEIRVDPLQFFNQLKIIKTRLYEH